MSFLKRTFRALSHAVKTPPHLTRQTYAVRYQITVRNTSAKPNTLTIAAPVPSAFSQQSILTQPRFSPNIERLGKDSVYGNQFAVWQAKLAPGESRLFVETFQAAISPVKSEVPEGVLLTHYPSTSSIFKNPTEHLEAGDERIKALSKEAVGDAKDVATALRRINESVMGRLEYGNPIKDLYGALEALNHVKVDCGGYDSLFVALCIAAGIPARIVSGFWAGYSKNDMHAWVEVQLPDGSWLPADPSTESLVKQGRTHKFGKLGSVGSDRIIFSIGCDIPVEVSNKVKKVDILQHPFVSASGGEASFAVEAAMQTTKA